MATSTPRAVNRWIFSCMVDGTWPTMRWACIPTPSMGTPCALSDLTSLTMAVDLAPVPSILKSLIFGEL